MKIRFAYSDNMTGDEGVTDLVIPDDTPWNQRARPMVEAFNAQITDQTGIPSKFVVQSFYSTNNTTAVILSEGDVVVVGIIYIHFV